MQFIRQFPRHILHRMHGDVGAAFQHRDLKFLDEKSFAANQGERSIKDTITGGGEWHQLGAKAGPCRFEGGRDMAALP